MSFCRVTLIVRDMILQVEQPADIHCTIRDTLDTMHLPSSARTDVTEAHWIASIYLKLQSYFLYHLWEPEAPC